MKDTAKKMKFSDKHPVLSLLLFTYGSYLLAQYVFGMIFMFIFHSAFGMNATEATTIGAVIGSLIVLALWYKRCSPELRIRSGKGSFIGSIKFLAPILIYWIAIVATYSTLAGKLALGPLTLGSVTSCLMAGVSEEIIFREISITHMTKYFRGEKMIPVIALVSAIMFGSSHFLNVIGTTEGLLDRIGQVVLSVFFGYFFSAVYLRKGNVWAVSLMHTLHDLIAFSAAAGISGIYSGDLPNWIMMLFYAIEIGLALYGHFCLLRKSKRKEIVEFWDHKWSRDTIES